MSHNPNCRFSGVDCEVGCDCEGRERDELGYWSTVPCRYFKPRIPDRDYADNELDRRAEQAAMTIPGEFEQDPMDVCGPYH